MTIRETSRFKRFVNGRGFYVALAACLLAVGGLAVATFGETLFVAKEGESSPDSQTKPVEQIVSDLPDDRKTTTTTTTVTTTTATTVAADLYILPFGNLVQKAYGFRCSPPFRPFAMQALISLPKTAFAIMR
jgi:hypothetical protein